MTDQSTAVADVYPTRTGGDFLLMPREDPVTRGTPDDGPLDASELEGFATNGYLTHPELVTPDEVEEFRAELRRMVSDPGIRAGESTIIEASSQEVLSLFAVHESSEVFRKIAHDPRLVSRARQVLGTDVYIHQSRVDAMPGFGGGDVFWHSDFETWHAEDGMPRMRAVSISISLTRNSSRNGPLMIMPGSHTTYVSCPEATPEDDDTASLTTRGAGTPSPDVVAQLADRHGIDVLAGSPGSAVMFDCNCMHGSNGNISPYPRSTLSFVYNSVENTTAEPFGSLARRPEFLGARHFTPGRSPGARPGGGGAAPRPAATCVTSPGDGGRGERAPGERGTQGDRSPRRHGERDSGAPRQGEDRQRHQPGGAHRDGRTES